MTWAPVPLPGTKLGLLSLGWLQGEGYWRIVTYVNSIFRKEKKSIFTRLNVCRGV